MKKKKFLIITISVSLLLFASFFIYFNDYYQNIDLISFDEIMDVKITEYDDYYFIDGMGSENAFIFYQGAKVDELAYLSLLRDIALKGVDCFLIKMPFNFALFGIKKASKIIEGYDYNFYIGGHSLGGVCACMYAYENVAKINGVILFASYSSKDLSNNDLKVLSIYGTEDMVLNKEAYIENIVYLPSSFEEYVIEGGNHAYFGTYGFQKGDGIAKISNQEQIVTTSDKVVEFIVN